MERFLKLAAGAAAMLIVAGGAQAATPAPHAAKAPAAHATRGKVVARRRAVGRTRELARLGGHPNLNGIWQAMGPADSGLEPHDAQESPVSPELLGAIGAVPPSRGVVEGGTIPYLAAALKQREDNLKTAPKADPEAACYLPGIPRATYALNMPFQIIQGDKGDMLMAYQYDSANRTIYMQKAELPPVDTWMGTSYGQWEGDTLVVTTMGNNGMTWLDRAGDFIGTDAKVTERFKLIDHDHMSYTATVEDPMTFSRPWTISMVLYRNVQPNAELLDFRCVPFADLLVYGDLLNDKTQEKK